MYYMLRSPLSRHNVKVKQTGAQETVASVHDV